MTFVPPPPRKGRRLKASYLTDLANRTRSGRTVAAGGMGLREGSPGMGIVTTPPASPDPGGFWAKVGGAGPEYVFIEVIGTAAGGWIGRPHGKSDECKEANGVTGLAGKVVWMLKEAGTYRFVFRRKGEPGLACGPVTVTCCVVAWCCDLAGATMTVTTADGTVLGGCTAMPGSNPFSPYAACCSIAVSVEPGTVLIVTATHPTYGTKTKTITVTCDGGSVLIDFGLGVTTPDPPDLHVTITGTDAIVGGGWTGAVHYDAANSNPTLGHYAWDSGCLAPLGGWGMDPDLYYTSCEFPFATDPPGICSGSVTVNTINAKRLYQSARVRVTWDRRSVVDGGPTYDCSFTVNLTNYWDGSCALPGFFAGPFLGLDPFGRRINASGTWWCVLADCPCGTFPDPGTKDVYTELYGTGNYTIRSPSNVCECWPCPDPFTAVAYGVNPGLPIDPCPTGYYGMNATITL